MSLIEVLCSRCGRSMMAEEARMDFESPVCENCKIDSANEDFELPPEDDIEDFQL